MIEFGVLGPLLATDADGTALPLGGPRQRAVLAALLLAENRLVPVDAMVDAVWADAPPRTARRQVQNRISALRTVFGADSPIVSEPAGYRLTLETGQLDADTYLHELRQAQRHWMDGAHAHTAAVCRRALARWRGPALAGLSGPGAGAHILRLEELRLEALSLRIDADLALGRHRPLIAELTALVHAHPMREHFCAQLMTALHRAGRRVEALSTFDNARRRLADEFGLEPGSELTYLRDCVRAGPLAMLPDPGVPPRPHQLAPTYPEPPGRRIDLTAVRCCTCRCGRTMRSTVDGPASAEAGYRGRAMMVGSEGEGADEGAVLREGRRHQ